MPDLPRGTVAFLFTDVEGSTVRWERDRAAMAAAVEHHLVLLRQAVEANGGTVFKVVGDAVQAAFPAAPAAVAAALAAQRALLTEAWGTAGPLRVRIALHAGEAAPDAGGDYLAAPLNRLARLLAAGHGGQVLLSQAVQQLARGTLPPEATLRDLGEHRLRDLLEPERVFQLLHPELPTDFPPLLTLDARPHNLPRQPTPFLGRERAVGEVVDLLRRDDVQLVTLTGPGGTGKTRLALQAAADLLGEFDDGAFFVPLAPLTDPALVPAAVASVLGVREEGGRPVRERLGEVLAAKRLLLLIDNVEHLLEAAPFVGQLLASCPGVKVLATSRAPLRLAAEREYPVPPLALPRRRPPPTAEQLTQFEAVRLFIARAQAVRPGFAVDNETAPVVAELCWRLDGLPLAIELAAARVRMLPPAALLARLEQRLPFLTGGARDAPARQRTLRDAIAWSYDLLDPDDQTVFRRLAVFAGGCTIEAAEAVANPDRTLDVFGGLERLVEQSLLRLEDGPAGSASSGSEPRFGMLETVREYGLEQLNRSSDEEREVRRAHAGFFADLVIGLYSDFAAGRPEAIVRIAAEQDNVRALLVWLLDVGEAERALWVTASLSEYWMFTGGQFGEGRSWLDRALALPGETTPEARSRALYGVSIMARHLGEFAPARTAATEALAHARASNNPSVIVMALFELSLVNASTWNSAEALALANEALRIARDTADPKWLPWTLFGHGVALRVTGDPIGARAALEEALDLSRQFGDRWCELESMWLLGIVIGDQGELGGAASLLADSIVARSLLGGRTLVGSNLLALAEIANRAGYLDAAAMLIGAAAAQYGREEMGPAAWLNVRGTHPESELRQRLGAERFDRAMVRGKALSAEEATAQALAVAAAIQEGAASSPAAPGPA